MAKKFYVKIVSGSDLGPYNVYYDQVNSANFATNFDTSFLATGVTLTELTVNLGLHISVPDNAASIIVYNTNSRVITECVSNIDQTFLPTPTPSPSPSPSPSASPSPTPSPTSSPSPTPSPTPNCDFNVGVIVLTATPTPTPSPTPSSTPPPSATPSPSATPAPTANCEFSITTTVNYSPTDISLSHNRINENSPSGTTVGYLSTQSIDSIDSYTYSLPGSAPFIIFGDALLSSQSFNYEVATQYVIAIRTTDSVGQYYDKQFTIYIDNVNEAPYGIGISGTIPENSAIGTNAGTLSTSDPDAGDTFTYSFIDTGSFPDNNSFDLSSEGVLTSNEVFDVETKAYYQLRVRTTDSGGLTYDGIVNVTVTSVNESPTGIDLSSDSISENLPTGTTIGTLSTVDPDSGDTFTYSFVDHGSYPDNGSFIIDGNTLKTRYVFNYETKNTYYIKVRSTDALGLYYERAITIYITDVIIGASWSITGVTCNGGSDGRIEITNATGGTANYTYSKNGINYQSSNLFTGLTAGSYDLYVKDSNGEVGALSPSATVSQPSLITFTATGTEPTCNGDTNGSIVLSSVSGGVAPYTYSKDGSTYQSSATFTGLANGTYTMYVKDSSGCVRTNTVGLNKTQVSATISQINVPCYQNGSASITISDGAGGNGGPYQAKVNNGVYQYQNLPATFGVPVGTHSVTVIDSSLCSRTYSVTITQPTALIGTISASTNPICYNSSEGTVTVSASGGTSPYTYSTDGISYYPNASGIFAGLSVGTYTFYIKDANECITSVGATLSKSAPEASYSITNVSCNGGSNGSIVVSSGTGGSGSGYQAKLGEGGTYANLPVTYSSLSTGSYLIYIKDSAGCVQYVEKTVTQPTSVGISTSQTNPTCWNGTDGSITVSGSGGTGSYTYSKDGTNYQSSGTFSSLGTGLYTVYVRDSNGCTTSDYVLLSKSAPNATITVINAECNAGTGTISVSDGYGGSGSGYQVANGSGGIYENLPKNYTSLQDGTYTIYIKDGSGCVQTYSRTVTKPSAVSGSITSASFPTCYNSTNGSLTIQGGGGTPNASGYKYDISSNGAPYSSLTTFKTSHTFSNLASGNHSIQIIDNNSCFAIVTYNLTVSTPELGIVDVGNVSCYGGSNGFIEVTTLNGGSSPRQVSIDGYNYFYPPKTFSSLVSDTYTLYVKDGNGCVAGYGQGISQPTQQTASLSIITNPTCASPSSGVLELTSSGGVFPKTYRLYADTDSPYTTCGGDLVGTYSTATYGTTFNVDNLTSYGYCLEVTDANGCVTNSGVTAISPPATFYRYEVLNCGNYGLLLMTSPDLLSSQFIGKTVKIDNICYQINYLADTVCSTEVLHLIDGNYAAIYNTCEDCTGGGPGQFL